MRPEALDLGSKLLQRETIVLEKTTTIFSYVHRDRGTDYYGLLRLPAQDGHLDFHTASELCRMFLLLSVALRPQKP